MGWIWKVKVVVFFIWICSFLSVDLIRAREKESVVYESKPEELVIYEGDLAYARDRIKINPANWVQVYLPHSVIARTLRIIDEGKKIKRFYFTQKKSIKVSIKAPGLQNAQIVKWKSKTKKSRTAVLNYLLRSIGWSPVYTMDILSDNLVNFRYNVAIFNKTLPLSNVKIKLVSGMVSKISKGSQSYNKEHSLIQRELVSYDYRPTKGIKVPTVGSLYVNGYYIYDLGQIEFLEKGRNHILLLEMELEVRKEFVWFTSKGKKVDVVYKVKNSSDQPFAAGVVDVYQDGIYLGSDMIDWTPSGSRGHIVIGGTADIQVKKTVNITEIHERSGNGKYHHEVALKVENFSKKNIVMKIIDNKYPDCIDIAFSLMPIKAKAKTFMWQIELRAGKSRTIKYDFYSHRTYYEPYLAY